MTSAPAVQNTTAQASADPERDASDAAVRLPLKADTTTPTGQVDGGWWPHSKDLAAELPELFSTLALRSAVDGGSWDMSGWYGQVSGSRLAFHRGNA